MISPNESFGVDISDTIAGLEELARAIRQPVGNVLKERSGFFARYLAEWTFPVADVNSGEPDGGGVRARDMGRAAVRRDIARVYVPISAMVNEIKRTLGPRVAKAFVKLTRTDPHAAERLLKTSNIRGAQLSILPWDGGALHRRKRTARGSINQGSKPVLITDPAALKQYRSLREKRVGFAKSGWITAGRQITSRGMGQVSRWISGQGGPGTGLDRTQRENDPYVALTNNVSYIGRVFEPRNYTKVENAFRESLAEQIAIELAKLAERANARTLAKGR